MTVFGSHNEAVPAHGYKGAITIGDALQPMVGPRIAAGPTNPVIGGNNGARITDGHKNAVAVSDATQPILRAGILAVHSIPSAEVTTTPSLPTATKTPSP